jgi:hypothetical protein
MSYEEIRCPNGLGDGRELVISLLRMNNHNLPIWKTKHLSWQYKWTYENTSITESLLSYVVLNILPHSWQKRLDFLYQF